ncbi:subtilisin-like protease [Colletotrichum plurivorum]|uniref:Subtilisin-like protease n=1 Tax=Colletotrichum plurivorum TaxID=2175906 RepID=A0A8H6JRY2_9PEZI|nr:subtilisin-like protease [Colletotrichum plurivorum]
MGFSTFGSLLVSLLLSTAALSAEVTPAAAVGDKKPFAPPARRFAVQFSSSGSAKFRKRDGTPDTEGFFESLQLTNNTAKPALNFTSDIFHGASFDLVDHTATSLQQIEELPEVEKLWPVSVVYAAKPNASDIMSEPLARWDPHALTGVSKVHKLGHRGEGVVVGIIDTGIDYTHPNLGAGFGAGFKVEGGYDLVGDEYEIGGEYMPDDDPMDCAGHGTHVAGIVASTNEDLPGVAPDARIRIYKVFGCDGSSMEDVIAQGFIKAHEDGVDIISASLGSNSGFPENILAVVASNIQAKGTFVTVAAGNSGEMGPFYTSSASNGFGVTSVGSVEHTQTAAFTVTARSSGNETRELVYVSSDTAQWLRNGSFPAHFLDQNYTGLDSCEIWEFPDVSSDSVLILPRSTCTCECWQVLDSALYGTSVKWVFYYNFEGAAWEIPNRGVYNPEEQALGFGLISYEDGQWLLKQKEAGRKVDFEFVENGGKAVGLPGVNPDSIAGAIDFFSSWGLTVDARLKPEISAPGGSILSTYLTSEGGWAVLSGTSMATPYIAGVAALYFSANGGRANIANNAGDAAHHLIASSGDPVAHFDGSGALAPIPMQGAGIVDAFKVLTYKTSVAPAVLHLNDTDHFQGTHEVRIENKSDKPVTYHIAHEAGSTITTKPNGDAEVVFPPVPYSSAEGELATITFSTTTLEVAAGATGTFTVTFVEPAGIDARLFPIYGGWINVIGSNDEALRVTYAGIKGSVYGSNIWADNWIDPVLYTPDSALVKENDTFKMTVEDTFTIDFDILWPTREFSFDLVEPTWEPSDWSYPFVPGTNKYVGSLQHYNLLTDTYFDAPVQLYPRLSSTTWWPSGNFSHGAAVESGEYKVLCRALRTYGDYRNVSDWQIRVSPKIIVDKNKA